MRAVAKARRFARGVPWVVALSIPNNRGLSLLARKRECARAVACAVAALERGVHGRAPVDSYSQFRVFQCFPASGAGSRRQQAPCSLVLSCAHTCEALLSAIVATDQKDWQLWSATSKVSWYPLRTSGWDGLKVSRDTKPETCDGLPCAARCAFELISCFTCPQIFFFIFQRWLQLPPVCELGKR